MNLSAVQLQTTWNDAAGSINSNYAKIADAIAQLKANGGGGGGTADTVTWADVSNKPAWIIQAGNSKPKYSYDELTDTPDLSELATKTWVESELSDYAKTEDIPTTVSQLTDSGDYLKKASAETTYAKIASIQGFENRIGGLEGAVPQLNERVTTVDGKVSSLNETVSTGKNNLLDRVNVIEEEYATKTYVDNAIDGIDLSAYLLKADLTKSRIQSTLGISDWALAATKPSYTAAEVGALSLGGGTVTGEFTVNGQPMVTKAGNATITFSPNNREQNYWFGVDIYGSLFITDNGYTKVRAIIHEDNIGHYKAGDSDKLGGKSKDYYIGQNIDVSQVIDLNTIERNHIIHGNKWSHNLSGTIASVLDISYSADWRSQLLFNLNTKRIYSRFFVEGYLWSDWQQIAFITDNVASATKLKTPRKLWGQSFDGSAHISGAITLPNNTPINVTNSAGTSANNALLMTTGDNLYLGYGTAVYNDSDTYIWGKNIKFINKSGQVIGSFSNDKLGIGVENPTEKLDVAGNVKASGNINATSITINGVTITASNGSITVNGNVIATGSITQLGSN